MSDMKAVLFEADNVEGFRLRRVIEETIFLAIEKYDLLELYFESINLKLIVNACTSRCRNSRIT